MSKMMQMMRADRAKDKMRALLQGMEIWQESYGSADGCCGPTDSYRLSDDGRLQIRDETCAWRDCEADEMPDWDRKATASTPRPSYAFSKALGMMAEGKAMMSMATGIAYKIIPGRGLVSRREADSDIWVGDEAFFDLELAGMWQEAE